MYYYNCRAIDIQALVGNIGGYIGLLLGYSLLQIPDLISWTKFRFKFHFNASSAEENTINTKKLTFSTSSRKMRMKSNGINQDIQNSSVLETRNKQELYERMKSLEAWRAEITKILDSYDSKLK